jgi:hypothetical protein
VTVKYIVISRLAPGIDNARKALEVFQKAGLPPGTEAVWAGTDGKTFINIVESDAPDITGDLCPLLRKNQSHPGSPSR